MQEILKQLIQYKIPNIEMMNYLKECLDGLKFKIEVIPYKDNIYSLFAFLDLQKKESLLFSGHLDVVNAGDLKKWNYPPYLLSEDKDNFYGRGVCDMKGQISCLLGNLPEMIKNSKYNLMLSFSCDEETTTQSIYQLIKHIENNHDTSKIKECIVLEATENQIGISHKGGIVCNIDINGVSGHSSNPENGVNSIVYGNKILNYIQENFNPFYDKNDLDNSSTINISAFKSDFKDNIIPNNAKITFSIRPAKFQADKVNKELTNLENYIKTIEKSMKSKNDNCNVSLNIKHILFPFKQEENSFIKQLNLPLTNLSYGCEASFYKDTNIDTIVLGAGSIRQAHSENEYISKRSLEVFKDILKTLVIT
jgi:acetylornithine deacetylase/succinyl-diaminopimelate desuccinylase-like protein